jgi:hypothetical protein
MRTTKWRGYNFKDDEVTSVKRGYHNFEVVCETKFSGAR